MAKQVRFAEDTNTWYENTVVLEEHEHELLYTQGAEQLAVRRKLVAETSYFESQNCGVPLADIFSCPIQEQINRLVKLNQDAAPSTPRGLERQISDDHREIRTAMRRRQIQAVLNQQQAQLKASLAYNERSEVLASISEELSNSARTFARILAVADEQIVAFENEKDEDCYDFDDDISLCSSVHTSGSGSGSGSSKRGTGQKRTTSGKLAKMLGGMRNRKSTLRGRGVTRRNSPTSSGEELRESYDMLVQVQQRY